MKLELRKWSLALLWGHVFCKWPMDIDAYEFHFAVEFVSKSETWFEPFWGFQRYFYDRPHTMFGLGRVVFSWFTPWTKWPSQ